MVHDDDGAGIGNGLEDGDRAQEVKDSSTGVANDERSWYGQIRASPEIGSDSYREYLREPDRLTERIFNAEDLVRVQTRVGAGYHHDCLSRGLGKGLELKQGRRRRECLGILAARKLVSRLSA